MNRKRLAIYGAGGLGRELHAWIQTLPEFACLGFFDDHVAHGSRVNGVAVLGGLSHVEAYGDQELCLVIAVGDPQLKNKLYDQLSRWPWIRFPVLIHPRAVLDLSASIEVGEGSVVTAGCVLTTGIRLGKQVLLNLNCTVGHDCFIDDFSSLMPAVNLSGGVTVGKNVFIGTGATLLNNLAIGAHTIVGAGAVVLKSLPAACTAVGVPAKIIRHDSRD